MSIFFKPHRTREPLKSCANFVSISRWLLQFVNSPPPYPLPPKKETTQSSIGKKMQLQITGMSLQLKTQRSYYCSVKLLEFCNKPQIAALLTKAGKENKKKINFHIKEEVATPSRGEKKKKRKHKTSILSLRERKIISRQQVRPSSSVSSSGTWAENHQSLYKGWRSQYCRHLQLAW